MSVEVGQATRSPSVLQQDPSYEIHRRISGPRGATETWQLSSATGLRKLPGRLLSGRDQNPPKFTTPARKERQWQRIDYGAGGANSPMVRQLSSPF